MYKQHLRSMVGLLLVSTRKMEVGAEAGWQSGREEMNAERRGERYRQFRAAKRGV